jgi:hypothetical protein
MTAAVRHARTIEHNDETGDDREYNVSCACGEYRGRLRSYAEAVEVDRAHKAAVADGTWQAEQDAEAARLAALAPLNMALHDRAEAIGDRRSAALGLVVAQQHGGDVEAARAEYVAANEALAVAEATLADVRQRYADAAAVRA